MGIRQNVNKMKTKKTNMKQFSATITLVLGLLVTGWAQSGFVVAGNGNISVGQIFAIPTVTTEASSTPGLQQGYIVTADYADVRHEGESYSGYGFFVPASSPDVDTVLTHYDPDVRNYLGYDSITNLTLNIILIDCSVFAPATDGSGNQYEVVKLIHDCWLKSNLRTELYADGNTDVPDVRQYPGADLETYGYLYTYAAATGYGTPRGDTLQGICPDGWHLPTYDKIVELMQHYEAADLMATTNWINPGNNSSGFTMQPGGYYTSVGHTPYQMLLVMGYLWAYTPGSSINYACEVGSACGTMGLVPASADMGYSVRCLKDL